ncbi:MAG: glycoside hydrolase family 127 protein [bacterium]|nr:glycoside hydrolase family 127 protein [Candidatus Colisoma equi]
MKISSVVVIGLALVPVFLSADILTPAEKSVRLQGVAGASVDTCIRTRCYSTWAQNEMYEECVNAFRTHYDDQGNGSWWQGEYWGKTMLCFAGAAMYTQDPSLKDWIVGKTHAFLKEFQKPNGYLSTYEKEDFLRKNPDNPDAKQHWCFNIWGRKYTLWALVDIHKATGDKDTLNGAVKLLDHLIAQLKRLNLTIDRTGSWNGVSSMSILRPVLELYRLTKKSAYLDFAREIVAAMDRAPYSPASLIHDAFRKEMIHTWYSEPGFWAKAYETESCLEGLVDYYRLTGEKRVLDAVLAYYGHLEREEMNPMRTAGHFDHFWNAADQLNGMTEFCDVVHWIRLNRELLLVTGEAKYADRIDEAFHNAFLAGCARDGRWAAHIVRSHGTRHCWAPPQTGMFHHQCCPDNMMRTYFDLANTVGGVDSDGSLWIALYSDATAKLPGATVTISGGYPYADEPVVVTVTREQAGKVRFRVPSWSSAFTVNGEVGKAEKDWCVVDVPAGTSAWSLGFDMSPRIVPWTRTSGKRVAASPGFHSVTDVGNYTVHFMEWYTPEMAGLCRNYPGFQVMRGPLVLAKGRLAGTPRGDTFFSFATENGCTGWRAALKAMPCRVGTAGVPRTWMLTLTRGVEERSFAVSDFASLSNVDDPDNWFSLWF